MQRSGQTDRTPTVAAALELAAQHANDRGSASAGALLAELAVSRTPPSRPADLQRRRFDAAERIFRLGEPARAWDIAVGGVELSAPGPGRVRGLLLLATIAYWTQGDDETSRWCRQALGEAGDDPLLLARCHLALADMTAGPAAVSLEQARAAVALLEQVADPPTELLSSALKVTAYHELRAGNGLSLAALERAADLDAAARPVPVMERAGMVLGMLLRFACRFNDARRHLEEMLRCAEDEGDDGVIHHILGHLALLECWAGDYEAAIGSARAGRELMAETGMGSPSVTSAHSLAEAHLGRLELARAMAHGDLAADEAQGELPVSPVSCGASASSSSRPATSRPPPTTWSAPSSWLISSAASPRSSGCMATRSRRWSGWGASTKPSGSPTRWTDRHQAVCRGRVR